MLYRTLGRTGLRVSLMSLGTGGPSVFGQRTSLSQQGRRALVRRALDLGVNLFDTAGEYLRSEEMLGDALRGVPRDSYLIATKWKHWGDNRDVLQGPAGLMESVELSLARLETDYLDVLQFHGVLADHYEELVERLYPAMERLKAEGKIRYIGLTEVLVSDPKHEAVTRALQSHPELWDTVMLKYGILNQWAAKEFLPLAQRYDVGVLNMAPVRLTLTRSEKMRAFLDAWSAEPDSTAPDLPGDDPLDWLVHDEVDSVTSAGYRFAASHDAISTVITGTSSVEHLEQNAAALEQPGLPAPDQQRVLELFGESASPN
jgi:L-galactose dehydrogenase